ncbi:hypothetical protein KFK09_018953 [Dendrobium nobile]|uniref:Endonuclease/exonuclease/phosphatase domain-containing protein n=1 Tax=Dendrobium nobile TaxID=94219 RepID=A0A8T3AX89_DENNO|nr:hypothetical protein KFK09_018953 [Dendrobium nobile]
MKKGKFCLLTVRKAKLFLIWNVVPLYLVSWVTKMSIIKWRIILLCSIWVKETLLNHIRKKAKRIRNLPLMCRFLIKLKLILEVLMVKSLIWNIRGIGGKDSIVRAKNMCRIHHIHLLVIIEPLISMNKLDITAYKLGFSSKFANCSNKIWLFWNNVVNITILNDFVQVVNVSISMFSFNCKASFIYAACTRMGRLTLWKQLYDFAATDPGPWCIGGDFNIISNASERLGGNIPNAQAMDDFNSMISTCELHDIGFFGNAFTWSRGNLWQRLDRLLFNNDWMAKFHVTHVEHLSRTASDHAPLLLSITNSNVYIPNAFKF